MISARRITLLKNDGCMVFSGDHKIFREVGRLKPFGATHKFVANSHHR
jgi:hypothetical protein